MSHLGAMRAVRQRRGRVTGTMMFLDRNLDLSSVYDGHHS